MAEITKATRYGTRTEWVNAEGTRCFRFDRGGNITQLQIKADGKKYLFRDIEKPNATSQWRDTQGTSSYNDFDKKGRKITTVFRKGKVHHKSAIQLSGNILNWHPDGTIKLDRNGGDSKPGGSTQVRNANGSRWLLSENIDGNIKHTKFGKKGMFSKLWSGVKNNKGKIGVAIGAIALAWGAISLFSDSKNKVKEESPVTKPVVEDDSKAEAASDSIESSVAAPVVADTIKSQVTTPVVEDKSETEAGEVNKAVVPEKTEETEKANEPAVENKVEKPQANETAPKPAAQANKLTVLKNKGLTQSLLAKVKELDMELSDGKITSKEWNDTIDKLIEIQNERIANKQKTIFSGGTDRKDFRKSFVVNPNQDIEFSEDEMKSLYAAMGASFKK